MPYVNHNKSSIFKCIKGEPSPLKVIEHETEKLRTLLRNLRSHVALQGPLVQPPIQPLIDIGLHANYLSRAIQGATVRHEAVDEGGKVIGIHYEPIIEFVDNKVKEEQDKRNTVPLEAQVPSPSKADEYEKVYRDLGFSEQEYKDLLTWQRAHESNPQDLTAAFSTFADKVARDLMEGRYPIEPKASSGPRTKEVIQGVGGLVGVGIDTASLIAGASEIPAFVASCHTGIVAMATNFAEVRDKLLRRGK